MPATRRNTRSQRRAQPTNVRPASSRQRESGRVTSVPTVPLPDDNVGSTIASAAHSDAALSDSTVQRIVTAVSQAVLASLNAATHPVSSTSTAESREIPLVSAGMVVRADATTQGPVATALQHVSGENFVEVSQATSSGMSVFNSVSIPVEAQVNSKLKSKIWANEFFDFGLLLSLGTGDTRYHLSLSAETGSSMPTLSLEPTQKTRQISNIETWTSAFQIFVGVYTGKYPMEAPALMKYGEVVRDLAARGGDWRFYDTQFRFLRQNNPAGMPWGTTHWELWIRAQHFNNSRPPKPQAARNSFQSTLAGPLVPKGFCRKFHRGFDCQGCNFKHQCHKCGAVHPSIRCTFRSSRPLSKPSPSAAKSRPTNTSSN